MLELNKTKLKLKINGEVLEMAFPTVIQLEKFAKELGEKSEVEVFRDLFFELGMGKDVFNTLEMGHVKQIVDVLKGEKKN